MRSAPPVLQQLDTAPAIRPIVDAARECFARFGVHRTRMEDVAARAGMARRSLYRYVGSREQLIELALVARCREFGEALSASIDMERGVPDVLVDLIAGAVLSSHDDEEFAYLVEAGPHARLTDFLSSVDSPFHEMVRSYFEPVFQRARKERLFRTDASDDDLLEWIQVVMTLFATREHVDADHLRHKIRMYVLPAILAPAAQGRLKQR
jgi:AcrR family transcriptional regulator